ncbi:homoserine kinase [soil metagenome]
MAVYTPLEERELVALLGRYDVGSLRGFHGIAEGIENSNFLVETDVGRFVLTVFERRVKRDELPFFMELMGWLSAHGFPAPQPVSDRGGAVLQTLQGKPACLVGFLAGRPVEPPTVATCREAGAGAARMHVAAEGFPGLRPNALSVAAWRPLFTGREPLAERLRPGLAGAIAADLDTLEAAWPMALPRGVIHADLFADNVFLHADGAFAGVIDFYFACTDALAYDLAVMLNAWAFEGGAFDGGGFDRAKVRALIEGYEAVRPLTPAEREALPVLAHGAAMRFFLTRLADWEATPDGAIVTRKDPLDYADRLVFHRAAADGTGPSLLDAQ